MTVRSTNLVRLQDAVRISFGSPPTEYSLAQLLPARFGPADLLEDPSTPLLLEPQDNRVALVSPPDSPACQRDADGQPDSAQPAAGEALSARLLRQAAAAALGAANKVQP